MYQGLWGDVKMDETQHRPWHLILGRDTHTHLEGGREGGRERGGERKSGRDRGR